jgi:hypothetical protein
MLITKIDNDYDMDKMNSPDVLYDYTTTGRAWSRHSSMSPRRGLKTELSQKYA